MTIPLDTDPIVLAEKPTDYVRAHAVNIGFEIGRYNATTSILEISQVLGSLLTALFDTTMANRYGDWQIQPDILYLDNGAFGACPIPVSEKQRQIQQRIEENPHAFFERSYISAWQTSREALAGFLNADPAGLVLLQGATYGMNAVIQSLDLNRDGEILTTNHAYSSVCLTLEHVAKRNNARVVIADIPISVATPDDILQAVLNRVTPRTRFAVIDHIPSRSGLVFPIKRIVSALDSLNIDTLVDGAHAPGMISVDLKDINAALEHNFTWQGTNDQSAMMCLPSAIEFLNDVVPGGYKALTRKNHELAVPARRIICSALGTPVPCPDDMIGAMATIPLPDSVGIEKEGMLQIQQTLWREHGIAIPVYSWLSYPSRVIRLSVQAYNTFEQYLRLTYCLNSVLYSETSRIPKTFVNPRSIQSLLWTCTHRVDDKDVLTPSLAACSHESDHRSNGVTCLPRGPHEGIVNPSPRILFRLAQARIRSIAKQQFASYPVALYPTAGEAETQFSLANTPKLHANMEISRVTYMLSCVDRRRIPQMSFPIIARLLQADDVIERWPSIARILRNQAQTSTRTIVFGMNASSTPAEFPTNDQGFASQVVPYATESKEQNLSLRLWVHALGDFTQKGMASSNWSPTRVEAFLQIHAFLKDPVCGLRKDSKAQSHHFLSLLSDLKLELNDRKLMTEICQAVAAQLALESSFMAHSEVQNAAYVHFSGNQQLVYSYVDVDILGRSEFASLGVVVEMIQGVLDSGDKEHSLAPVAIAYSYPICSSHESREVIVDGNNRVTSIILLRFISIHGVPDAENVETLRNYCRDYGLGQVCFVDLCAVLQLLRDSHADILERLRISERLSLFRRVTQIPALITEESSFLTTTIVDKGEEVLQPVHQNIFATDDLLVAFPAKMQRHGRAKGFKALPIR
ncbi:hypothetical protein QQX98_008204 [Neonectria punicea]|uniref:Aminotransferase class V domain-containing protein n=1 Tax=Neonectria punicea TaxID=979145 RepID=A0ABR1GVQ1_9HYPO